MRDTLARLEHIIAQRSNAAPDSSYVASLFAKGRGKIAQKVGAEAADLLFHLMVLLAEGGVAFDDVLAELDRREGVSGLAEKAARDNSGE
jgi:phosphoribosyl-ATP pyrophosphohydrolase